MCSKIFLITSSMCLNQSTIFFSFPVCDELFSLLLNLITVLLLYLHFFSIQLLSIAPTGLSTYQISCPPKAYLLFVSQVRFRKK